MDSDTEKTISYRNAYNKARQEKMGKYPCWECRFLDGYCNPLLKCKRGFDDDKL